MTWVSSVEEKQSNKAKRAEKGDVSGESPGTFFMYGRIGFCL